MFFNAVFFVWTILSIPGLSHGQLEKIEAKSAGNYCENGLASYDDFKSKLADLSVLENDKSGWLSGYAELSSALSIESCFNTTIVGTKSNIINGSPENILGECVKYCNDTGYNYIGLQNNTCLCLDRKDLRIENRIKLSECQRACQTTFNFICQKYLVIYRKFTKQNYHGVGQCVYISKNSESEKTLLYSTASCHTVSGIIVHGFICHCGTMHNKPSDLSNFHVENVTHSWTEAYNSCASKNCSLVSMAYLHVANFLLLLPCCNYKYWTGGFRTITPVSNSSSNTCLAVKKVESKYFLDLDDCSTKKVPICSTSSSYIGSNTFSTFTETSVKQEKELKGSNQVAVAVGLTLGILASIVIIVCVVARYIKSRKTSSANKTLLTHENDFTVSGTEDYAVIDGEQSAVKAECPQGENLIKDTKDRPIKPERLTLRRQKKAVQAYENFQLVPVEDKKTSDNRSQDNQYDRVDLTRPYHRNNETVPLEADLQVYNHTMCDDDSYDVTLPRQKTNFSNQDYDAIQPEDINLYNTPDMVFIVKDVDCLNTLKTVEGSNSVSSENKNDYVYVDDDQVTLDDGTNNSAIHVYSEMDYDVVGLETTNTQRAKEQDDTVYEFVHKEYNNIDL